MNSEELFNIPLEGLEKYRITKDGRVWSDKSNKFLNQTLCNGYYNIKVNKSKTCAVHRLVAITFLENKNNCNIVNHIDEDPLNNNINNLEWVTQKENINKCSKETSHPRRVIQLDLKGNYMMLHESLTEAGEYINLTRHAINKVCLGINKSAGGYKWKYEDESYNHNNINLDNAVKIKGYDNYFIFKEGYVYNKQRKSYLKPITNKSGYSYVTLSSSEGKRNWYIHVLVAQHFIFNNDEKRTQVNHKNKIRNDNRLENLEWVTPSENMIHSKINNTKSK
jgi:hypothetical protein